NSPIFLNIPGWVRNPYLSGNPFFANGALWIIRQTNPGVLDWANPIQVELPEAVQQVTGFCLLPSEGSPPTMVVSTFDRVFLGKRESDSFRFSSLSNTTLAPRGGIKTLACGDFDGDGVQDVALSRGDSLEILRGLPRLP
ncbi:MAG: hypothetical protein NZX77_00625, partial [Polyangiaceae bacterium]|nr:hypothetical protein [Polyangiaceae bacterium]